MSEAKKDITPETPTAPDLPPIQEAYDAICTCGERIVRQRKDGPKAPGMCARYLTGKPYDCCQKNIPAENIAWGPRQPKKPD